MSQQLRAELESAMKARMEQLVADALQKGEERLTLTNIENIVLKIQKEMGEELTEALIKTQSEVPVPGPKCEQCGQEMHYKGQKSRRVVTRSGEVTVKRPYYYCEQCRHGFFPPG